MTRREWKKRKWRKYTKRSVRYMFSTESKQHQVTRAGVALGMRTPPVGCNKSRYFGSEGSTVRKFVFARISHRLSLSLSTANGTFQRVGFLNKRFFTDRKICSLHLVRSALFSIINKEVHWTISATACAVKQLHRKQLSTFRKHFQQLVLPWMSVHVGGTEHEGKYYNLWRQFSLS